MKKILLATTVLAATAGFAAAEVTLSGDARMGVTNNGGFDNWVWTSIDGGYYSTTADDFYFSSRARVKFTLSGESDSGLSFGASFRVKDAAGAADGLKGSVYVKGAFGKLSMGDNDNAALTATGQVAGVGYTSLNTMNEIGSLGHATTNVLYEYSADALALAVSAGQTGSDDFAIGAKYSTDAFAVALGYEDVGNANALRVSASGTFGGATLKALIVDDSSVADTQYALSVGYTISGAQVTAYYAQHAGWDSDDVAYTAGAYGIGASYDLGGGLGVSGGIAQMEGGDAIADLGLTMSF